MQNHLNSAECRGTSGSCGVFSRCPIDLELGDDVWTHNNGPYAFYFINGEVKISNIVRQFVKIHFDLSI